MSKTSVATIKIRRGLEAKRLTITPEDGELILALDTGKMYCGDGTTVGGNPIGGGCVLVDTQVELLAQTAVAAGDMALNKANGHLYVYQGGDAAVISNWLDTSAVSQGDVGLDLVKNYDITDAIDQNVSTLYASAKAVYLTNAEIQSAETRANAYADQVKSELLGNAPTAALDTLRELGDELASQSSAASALLAQIEQVDADAKAAMDAHIADKTNPHGVTQAQVGLDLVENKSVAMILADAALTGAATAPTVVVNSSDSSIATTNWVQQEIIAQGLIGIGDTIDGGNFG